MKLQNFLKGLGSAALNGTIAATAEVLVSGNADIEQTGIAATIGAVLGAANHLRKPPFEVKRRKKLKIVKGEAEGAD